MRRIIAVLIAVAAAIGLAGCATSTTEQPGSSLTDSGSAVPISALRGSTWRLTSDGYFTSDVYSSAVGYAGKDPDRTRVIEALDSLAYNVTKGSSDESAPVRAVIRGDSLTLTSATFTVVFARSGGAPTPMEEVSSTEAEPAPTGEPITGSESPN